MSDALPLPPNPSLEQYRKLAKELKQAGASGDENAVREWAARWLENLAKLREPAITPDVRRAIRWNAQRIEQQWNKNRPPGDSNLAAAQFFVARCHGFASWPKFSGHLRSLEREDSPDSQFERAVDAIVHGNIDDLRDLLQANPGLICARSVRDHHSTLLHYVSANGVEGYRQKTPRNIVAIARLLLDAGADVDAESGAYGGGSTTLGLTATSCHPQAAGLQIELLELLIARGARIERPDSGSAANDCLHNGRGEAAEFLAARGARLDLEGAAGVGRLDVVRTFFDDDGSLKPPATQNQLKDAFAWACQFGRTEVAAFLLDRGVELTAKLRHHGQTGLHWAALGGHAETVRMLLDHGAPVDVKDESFGGTPLEWALYGWGGLSQPPKRGNYYETAAMLARAGARLDPEWFEIDDEERRRTVTKLRTDQRMQSALG